MVIDRREISVVITTFSTDSYYTQACLEAIRRWKNTNHELIVVTHNESPLLRAYLEVCVVDGLIDRLVYAERSHGHTRSFNLGASYASGEVVFNVCNDILIGPSLVDDCAWQLCDDPQLGVIGWHWYNEGTFWQDGEIKTFTLRDPDNPDLAPEHIECIENAAWYTGRYFAGIGGRKWIQLCNTSFFGIRRDLLRRIGGGFGPEYPHYWADDFLCYAVLDQGLDVRNFDAKFRRREFFREFQYDNTDVDDRHRHADRIVCTDASMDAIRLMNGGMTEQESTLLHMLARAVPDGSSVTNVGVWLGSSAVVLLNALKDKRIHFSFLDCFDLPGISHMSAQPPVTGQQFRRNIAPFVGPRHTLDVIRTNTLERQAFPRSDFFFVDAGHTKECISHDARLVRAALADGGVAAFHDYGQPAWPDVKPALDEVFPGIEAFQTIAVHRASNPDRQRHEWSGQVVSISNS